MAVWTGSFCPGWGFTDDPEGENVGAPPAGTPGAVGDAHLCTLALTPSHTGGDAWCKPHPHCHTDPSGGGGGPGRRREAGLQSLCLESARGPAWSGCASGGPACLASLPPSPVGPAAKRIFAVSGEETEVFLRAPSGPAGRPEGPSCLPPSSGKLVRDIVWTPGRACGLSGGVQKGKRPTGVVCVCQASSWEGHRGSDPPCPALRGDNPSSLCPS